MQSWFYSQQHCKSQLSNYIHTKLDDTAMQQLLKENIHSLIHSFIHSFIITHTGSRAQQSKNNKKMYIHRVSKKTVPTYLLLFVRQI